MGIRDLVVERGGRPRTAPTVVASVLREAIIAGVLAPGEPLRQEEIAARFGLSRIPVREAFRQLEGEGLVEVHPHRGAVVTAFSLDELDELCDIRVALETMAIRLAVPHLSADDLARAEAIIDEADAMPEENARTEWAANNWAFHSTLYAAASRPRLFNIIKNLHLHFDRYVRMYFAVVGFTEWAQREHRDILEACRRGDPEDAASMVKMDIASVKEVLANVSHGGQIGRTDSSPAWKKEE